MCLHSFLSIPVSHSKAYSVWHFSWNSRTDDGKWTQHPVLRFRCFIKVLVVCTFVGFLPLLTCERQTQVEKLRKFCTAHIWVWDTDLAGKSLVAMDTCWKSITSKRTFKKIYLLILLSFPSCYLFLDYRQIQWIDPGDYLRDIASLQGHMPRPTNVIAYLLYYNRNRELKRNTSLKYTKHDLKMQEKTFARV